MITSKIRIVSISQKTFLPESDNIVSNHSIEFYPAISCNEKHLNESNTYNDKIHYFKLPFTLYESGISISTLCNYLGGTIKKDDFMVKKVFTKLISFAKQCADRVIADLCCQVIIKTSNSRQDDEQFIYFIEKSASDKMLGRLGTLFLDLRMVTICFLSYEPEDMFTNIISSQTGKLNFDLHRLMTRESDEPLGPYPGSSNDSLKQTFFYKPTIKDAKILPIRLDIFAQGLTEKDINEKCSLVIDNIFRADTRERIPHSIFTRETSPAVMLPLGFVKAKDRWKEYENKLTSPYNTFVEKEIKGFQELL